MIFVTVGTHEQPFNRLIKAIDDMKGKGCITTRVIMQTGFSTYEPRFCQWESLFPYKEMERYMIDARIIITHGGPSSFIAPLQMGKIPIVVPRQKKFREHVDDHQVKFANAVAGRQGNIIVVNDIEQLERTILDYDDIAAEMSLKIKSNNGRFCSEFEEIVNGMFDKKKR